MNYLMVWIQRYKSLSYIKTYEKYCLSSQRIHNKLNCQKVINNFRCNQNAKRFKKQSYSNVFLMRNASIFSFCSNNKQKEQNSIQKDFEVIKKFDLNDEKGFQNLIRQIGIKYRNQPQKSIQIFQKNIRFLKEKNCEKSHSFSYQILLALLLKLEKKKQISKMLPQVAQLIKFNDLKGINLNQIKSLLFSFYYSKQTPQDDQKAFSYLEDAYSDNTIKQVSLEVVLLIERKLNKLKLEEGQKLINSAVQILQKSQNFNLLASKIFKFNQKLLQIYLQQANTSKKQYQTEFYIKLYQKHTEIALKIVKYMTKWKEQLDKLQPQIVNHLTTDKKQNESSDPTNQPAYVLRWQYVTVLWNTYFSLMKIASMSNNHDEIITIFKTNEFIFQSLKMFNTSSIVNVYLFASKSFLALNRKEEALNALTTADEILFSITSQRLQPQIFIQLFFQLTQVIAGQNRQNIHKIQPEKFKAKLIALSKTKQTFLQQFQLRRMICDQYLSRQFYEKLFQQLVQLDDRLYQFRSKISKQSQLSISLTILLFKSSAYLRQRQFHKCIDFANKAENLIKIYKSQEEDQTLQNKIKQNQAKHFPLFLYIQTVNLNKSYAHINLAQQAQIQKIQQIGENQSKCLQFLQRVFAYESNQIKKVTEEDLMAQFQRFEQNIKLFQINWRTLQAFERKNEVYKNIIGQFQYLIVKAYQCKVSQNHFIYYSLGLQNVKISYKLLLAQDLKDKDHLTREIQKAINKLTQMINYLQKMIEQCKVSEQKQTWSNLKRFFSQRINDLRSTIKDLQAKI